MWWLVRNYWGQGLEVSVVITRCQNPAGVRQVKVDNQIRFVILRFKISC